MNLEKGRSIRNLLVCVILLLALFQILGIKGTAQCSLIDKSRSAAFISFEKVSKVRMEDGKTYDGVLLKLHNNSTCAIVITSGSAEKFVKPLPPNPTPSQLIKREVEYELPDGVLVPQVQYRYTTSHGIINSVRGDSFFGFKVLGKNSILFEVPFNHLGLSAGSKITLTFQYAWEQENLAMNSYPSVENTIMFWTQELPESVKARISNE